ncbi:MAG TPA: hypothetical protein VMG31_12890 [Verrucomicrobiae bacterium]|nr:hypothetical protein [Verrucomicrobiae bacterium]
MPPLAPDRLAQNLRETNARLDFLLDSLVLDAGQTRAASPRQMAGLLAELMRAGQWLRQLPGSPDPELQRELDEYRRKVERLKAMMPQIHSALLHDRARLEQERARVQSAAAWAERSRETL